MRVSAARLLGTLVLALAGCDLASTSDSRDPYGAFIGMTVPDLLSCAGVPDHVQRTGPDTAIAQWAYSSSDPALKLTLLLFGSVEVGGAESCKMVATILRDGTVVDVAFPGSRATLMAGPYAGCSVLTSECLNHPSSTGPVPRGYDALAILIPKNKS